MLAVTLTSTPPRFDKLAARLEQLLAQQPDRLLLCLPDHYTRVPKWNGELPALPAGVTLLRGPDHGPASKVIAARAAYPDANLLICDDDCAYGAGWLSAFRAAAATNPSGVFAASSFDSARLGARPGTAIVQGFGGVLLPPGLGLLPLPPRPLNYVDDIWLSASIASAGYPVRKCPKARADVQPQEAPTQLQNAKIDGQDRAALNKAAMQHFREEYGIW